MAEFSIQQVLQVAWQQQAAGQWQQAEQTCQQVLHLEPTHVEALNLYAIIAGDTGRSALAMDLIHRAIAASPAMPGSHINFGTFLEKLGDLDGAVAAYQRAIVLAPNLFHPHNNLGLVFQLQGRIDEAIECFRTAIQLRPDMSELHSNLLYAIHFHPDYDATAIFEAHRQWRERHADPLKQYIRPHENDRSPDRRLRIGYVSADFRQHVVGRFLRPILASHDRERFEIFCYSSPLHPPDALTDQLRRCADQWRMISSLSDEQAAERIRQDRIDILVNLGMHTAGNRLQVFARKPAPVQATYLAYCSTTGLDTIDYRLTDPHIDPPGGDERCYSERSVRLPQSYWCYEPSIETPEVSPLPALSVGHITFGCLNNFCKISPPASEAWCRLLLAVPQSRLVLHARDGSHRQRIHCLLAIRGIDPQRVRFVGFMPPAQYFSQHQRLDIALDPFPYGGGTTTCDALWMGVPVVTLRGRTGVGRGGASILCNVGLPELIADTTDDYIRIASDLANDLPRVAGLRQSLRGRMRQSPLMASIPCARALESAYRKMWLAWLPFASQRA